MNWKKTVVLVVLVLAAAVLSACSLASPNSTVVPATQAGEMLTELRVCGSSTGIGSWPLTYAMNKGLFEKYGLKVDYQAVNFGSDAVATILAGGADVCQVSGAAVVNAALVDEQPVIVAGLISRQPYSLAVTADVKNAGDLRGKVLAVSDFGGITETVLRATLEEVGLDPDSDVTLVAGGSDADRLAALQSGQIAGAIFSLLTLGKVTREGFHVLQETDALELPIQHTAVVTTRAFLADNRTAVEDYLQALIEARSAMSMDLENGPDIIADALLVDEQEQRNDIREVYTTLVQDYFLQTPYPSVEGLTVLIEQARRENPNNRSITAADIVDVSIIDTLDANGFIDSLYK